MSCSHACPLNYCRNRKPAFFERFSGVPMDFSRDARGRVTGLTMRYCNVTAMALQCPLSPLCGERVAAGRERGSCKGFIVTLHYRGKMFSYEKTSDEIPKAP